MRCALAAAVCAVSVVRGNGVALGCDGGCTMPSLGDLSSDELQLGLGPSQFKKIWSRK